MANNVSLPLQQTTPLAGNFSQTNFGIKNLVFAAEIVNKISWLNTVLSRTLLVGGQMIGVGEVSNGLYLLQHPSSASVRLPPSLHECLTSLNLPMFSQLKLLL